MEAFYIRKEVIRMKDKKSMNEKQNKKDRHRKQRYQINIKLDPEKDAWLIDKLKSQDNKQGYIKKLVLDDIGAKRYI